MTATSDAFTNAGFTNTIAVNSGGELTAKNSTFTLAQLSFDNNSVLKSTDLSGDVFNMPVSLPYNEVPVPWVTTRLSTTSTSIPAPTLLRVRSI